MIEFSVQFKDFYLIVVFYIWFFIIALVKSRLLKEWLHMP